MSREEFLASAKKAAATPWWKAMGVDPEADDLVEKHAGNHGTRGKSPAHGNHASYLAEHDPLGTHHGGEDNDWMAGIQLRSTKLPRSVQTRTAGAAAGGRNGQNPVGEQFTAAHQATRALHGSAGQVAAPNANNGRPNPPAAAGAADRIARAQHYTIGPGKHTYRGLFQRNGVDKTDAPLKGRTFHPLEYTDCGRFAHIVIGQTDPNFPTNGTWNQHAYVVKQTQKGTWESGRVGDGNGPKPGDWLWQPPPKKGEVGHVAIYGGISTDPRYKGQYIIYDASLEAGKHHGHPPKVEHYHTMPHFQMWGRPKQRGR
jgi:hypothetical protein